MSLLGYPELCGATSYRTHCYFPMMPSIAVYSSDVIPTSGHYLPSSCRGNLWLLDHCPESYCDAPSCESPNCEPKTCTTSCDLPNSCVPQNAPSTDQVISTCENTNVSSNLSCGPCTRTKGYVSNCHTSTLCGSKAYLRNQPNCFGQLNYLPKSFQPLSHSRLSNFGYRSYPNVGFIKSGFSPSGCFASSYQPQSHLMRNYQCLKYGPMSCPPLRYLSTNIRSFSSIPSTFPPLRYLCSGSRPLNCY